MLPTGAGLTGVVWLWSSSTSSCSCETCNFSSHLVILCLPVDVRYSMKTHCWPSLWQGTVFTWLCGLWRLWSLVLFDVLSAVKNDLLHHGRDADWRPREWCSSENFSSSPTLQEAILFTEYATATWDQIEIDYWYVAIVFCFYRQRLLHWYSSCYVTVRRSGLICVVLWYLSSRVSKEIFLFSL